MQNLCKKQHLILDLEPKNKDRKLLKKYLWNQAQDIIKLSILLE